MPVAEEAAGPAHAGLDLVHDQEGPVPSAQGLGLAPVGLGGQVDPLALDGLEHEGGHVALAQTGLQGVDVAERHRVATRQEGAEPDPELLAAVERQRPVGQAVERVVGVEDPVATGGAAGELDGRLHRLRTRVGEHGPPDAGVGPLHQSLAQQAGQQGAVQLGQVREVGVEGLAEGVLHHRVAPPQGEHPESGQEVEGAAALVVDQVGTLAPDVGAVEPEGGEDLGQLGIEVLARAARRPRPGVRRAVRRGRRARSHSGQVR